MDSIGNRLSSIANSVILPFSVRRNRLWGGFGFLADLEVLCLFHSGEAGIQSTQEGAGEDVQLLDLIVVAFSFDAQAVLRARNLVLELQEGFVRAPDRGTFLEYQQPRRGGFIGSGGGGGFRASNEPGSKIRGPRRCPGRLPAPVRRFP